MDLHHGWFENAGVSFEFMVSESENWAWTDPLQHEEYNWGETESNRFEFELLKAIDAIEEDAELRKMKMGKWKYFGLYKGLGFKGEKKERRRLDDF